MRRPKTLPLFTFGAVGILLILTLLPTGLWQTQGPASPTSTAERTYIFSRLTDPFPGQETSLSTAQATLPFKIRIPKILPPGLSLTHVRVVANLKLVYLIFTASKVGEPFSAQHVLSLGGMIMIQSWDMGDPIEVTRGIVDQSKGLWKAVSVNGAPGVGSYGKIHWWKDGVHFEILALQSTEQLNAIAESVS